MNTTSCIKTLAEHKKSVIAVEAPTDMIDQLGGWALKSVGQGYGDGYELALMKTYLSKASYDLNF